MYIILNFLDLWGFGVWVKLRFFKKEEESPYDNDKEKENGMIIYQIDQKRITPVV